MLTCWQDDPFHWCEEGEEALDAKFAELDKYIEALHGAREIRKLARVETQTTWSETTMSLDSIPPSWEALEALAEATGKTYFVVKL
jgi:hypothetical protein